MIWHYNFDELYKYLEVKSEQVRGAIANLSMLTPVEEAQSIYFEQSQPSSPNHR